MRPLLIFFCSLLALFAHAEQPLNRDQVSRFVEALEVLVEKQENIDRLSEEQSQQEALAMAQQYQEVIRDHGFDLAEWSRVSQRVFRAWGALNMDKHDVPGQMDKAREQIRNNPNLSEQAKQQMLQAYQQQQQALSQFSDSPDKQAVRPFAERLEALSD